MKTVITELEDSENDTDERKTDEDKHDQEAVEIVPLQQFKKRNLMIQLEEDDEVQTIESGAEKKKPVEKANSEQQALNEQNSEPSDAKSNEQSDEKQHEESTTTISENKAETESDIKGFKVSDQFMKLNFKQQNYMQETSASSDEN